MTNHTDTSRSGDLVERLDAKERCFWVGGVKPASPDSIFGEAADRLEALEAENERLREMVEYLGQELQKYRAKYMVGTSAALGEKQ